MGTGQAAAGQGKPGLWPFYRFRCLIPLGSQLSSSLGVLKSPPPGGGRARENVAPSTFPRPFLSQEEAGSTAQADPCHGPAMANFPRGIRQPRRSGGTGGARATPHTRPRSSSLGAPSPNLLPQKGPRAVCPPSGQAERLFQPPEFPIFAA